MPMFMKEVGKMILPNQQLTISVHQLNGDDEPILPLSLQGCRQTIQHREKEPEVYLSGECLWGHLHHQQDLLEDIGKFNKKNFFRKKQHLVREASMRFTFHIPSRRCSSSRLMNLPQFI